MAAADAARDEYEQYRCPVDDDRRKKEVAFVSDTPDGVLDEIEAKALESRKEEEQRRQMGAPLSQETRDKISDLGGFEDNTTFNWRAARGVFEREGVPIDRFYEMLSALADYDDPAEGAEQEISRARQADVDRGARNLSGDANAGEEDILEDRRAAEQARQAQQITGEQCSRAEEECEAGEREACEFLQEVCGVDEEIIHDVLLNPPEDPGAGELPEPVDGTDAVDVDRLAGLAEGPVDPRGRIETALAEDDAAGAIEGAALGALKRSWSGYQAAVSNAEDALAQLREQWEYAQQAARAINSIRDAHGQDPLHFDRLEEFQAEMADFSRQVARDCEECHADHSEHDHDTDTGDREDMRQAVLDGFGDTAVGTSTATETGGPEFAADLDLGMDPIDPADRQGTATDAAADLQLDTETLDPRGRAETALAGAGDQDAPDRMAGLRETGALNPERRIERATNNATGPEWDAGTVASITGLAYPAASDVVDTFRGWADWATHIDGYLSDPGMDPEFSDYGSTGMFRTLSPGAKGRLSKQMTPTAARRVLLEAGLPAMVEVYENAGKLPVGEIPDTGADAGDVIETDPQQSLGGGRANDQARLAGGEFGDVETEIESTDAENPGGMLADERGDTTDAPTGENTEQQVPDAFNVPEGGQDSLTDF